MIKLDNISYAYEDKAVFRDFSLSLPSSGITCISGPSGCGKTSLLRLLAGLARPESGEITGLPEKVGIMFQEDRLLPWNTALKNVAHVAGSLEEAKVWLERMKLSGEEDAYPRELSGGMRRRVSLARALAFKCGLLLLDEPFKGMDPSLIREIAPIISNHGIPVIVVTHSEGEAALLGGRLLKFTGPPMKAI
ncbi:MAG TPA: ATP-binding cassette domain-containing protein [Clostridiales bacterium]|jgi:NitT/TauT family transport system ATP-binding protein|nr:ATP-binding cassette domain-containing protein [Clostridiales bacterium]